MKRQSIGILAGCLLLVLATASAFIGGPKGAAAKRQLHKGINTIIVDAGHGGHDTGAKGSYSQEKDLTLQIAMKLGRTLHESLPGVRIVMTRTTDIFQPVGEKAQIANDNHGDLFLCIHCDYMPKIIHEFEGYRKQAYYTGKGANRKKHIRRVAEYRRYEVADPTPIGTATFIFTARKADDKVKTALEGLGEIDSQDTTNAETTLPSSPEARIEAMMWAKNYFFKSLKLGGMIEDEMGDRNRGVEQRYTGIRVLESTNMPSVLVETGFLSNKGDEDYLNSDAGQQEIADNITRAVIKYKAQVEGKTVEQVQDSAQANGGGLKTAGQSQRKRR
ncbi:MAG TPA: N-acetylmuramoyl-L-alanine amidase [Dinghuibacter sp.]|jgi:N-acetylmuramoyl-L-alanine amidase|uniref:N-acetylmuramoyl-L-alanine amidase family protein n=1 Tax=Dinghuibacter sp. TaxID=2024697 RepID=UPI002D12FE66|nr:N-acetylmuramoyl-L-alanine amidase [Dinghuibacter sp.]HTJ12613.1 N-acetylmuramoyl-L-alanine amidase [Dinghuibacter sp.]